MIQVRDSSFRRAGAVRGALRGLRFFYWLSWPEPESLLARACDCSARYPLSWPSRRDLSSAALSVDPAALRRCFRAEPAHEGRHLRARHRSEAHASIDGGGGRQPPAASPSAVRMTAQLYRRISWRDHRRTRLDVLVETLAELRRRRAAARLLIVGDAEYSQERAREPKMQDLHGDTGVRARPDALRGLRRSTWGSRRAIRQPFCCLLHPPSGRYLALESPVVGTMIRNSVSCGDILTQVYAYPGSEYSPHGPCSRSGRRRSAEP